jgi:hypothetical protein
VAKGAGPGSRFELKTTKKVSNLRGSLQSLNYTVVDEQERIILQVAAGELGRDEFTDWLRSHVVERNG